MLVNYKMTSDRLSLLAFIFTILCIIGASISAWSFYNEHESVKIDNANAYEVIGTIKHLDEVLTNSTRLLVLTGNEIWTARYTENVLKLDEAFERAVLVLDSDFALVGLDQTFKANQTLVRMEEEAFALTEKDSLDEAKAILVSSEYIASKRLYSEGINLAFEEILNHIRLKNEQVKMQLLVGLAAYLVGLILIGYLWWYITRKLHKTHNALEEGQASLQEAQRMARIGNWDWHIKEDIVSWSPEMYRLFDVEKTEIVLTSQTFLEGVHEEDHAYVQKVLARALNDNADYAVEFKSANTQERALFAKGGMEYDGDGRPYRMYGTVQDITVRKAIENELHKAKVLSDQSNEAKSTFLANMSHELRTPMNGIMGMLGMLLLSELDEAQKHKAQVAMDSAEFLLAVINDILDFSKIEAGMLEIEKKEFNLLNLLQGIYDILSLSAQEKRLKFEMDVSSIEMSTVIGDAARIRQVIINIVMNAIKFTSEGSVTLKAELFEHKGSLMLRCDIRDTGIGIAKEDIDNLFDRFTQADYSTTRQHGGTGLGLAICKQLVELMGGKIRAKSELGEGSRFSFVIVLENATTTEVSDVNAYETDLSLG